MQKALWILLIFIFLGTPLFVMFMMGLHDGHHGINAMMFF